ncbi:UNVERIFIED_CONTAM: hypothetical protein Slati_2380500 [Sesamum latifolium]|uniref:Uncharacterized protein n=1 Tax=Sesamum latifolium TaxID=2727402 RepID=A0AAW2WFN5_9LAMI
MPGGLTCIWVSSRSGTLKLSLGPKLADGSLSLPDICSYIAPGFRRRWCLCLLRVLDGWTVLLPVESGSLRNPPSTRNPSRVDVAFFIILRGGHVFLLTWRLHGGSLVLSLHLSGRDIGLLLGEALGLSVQGCSWAIPPTWAVFLWAVHIKGILGCYI